MAVEARRGCGYRKIGGLYVVADPGLGEPCERLPIPLAECPCCRRPPIHLTRGIQLVGAQYIFGMALPCERGDQAGTSAGHHSRCVLCNENLLLKSGDPKDKFFIVTIGKEHYPTPEAWTAEADRLGVSRRLPAIPKGLVLGKSWILVAHPEACERRLTVRGEGDLHPVEKLQKVPGIFHAFRPTRIELIVTPSMGKEKWVQDLVEKKGVTLVEVPEDDPDHAPRARQKSARARAIEERARKEEEE